jgi:quinoprotein glucose dehydrogenase
LLIASTNRIPFVVRLIPREEFDTVRASAGRNRMTGEFARQAGTPYGMYREPLLAPGGTLCNPPPWGALTAVDASSGETRWEVPLGVMPQLAGSPEAAKWGAVNMGGSVATRGGLVFIAAALDPHLRAFDIDTGRELWQGKLPATAMATPMTYELNGKQYVVIAAGGHGKAKGLGAIMGDHVVAFALP